MFTAHTSVEEILLGQIVITSAEFDLSLTKPNTFHLWINIMYYGRCYDKLIYTNDWEQVRTIDWGQYL